MARETQLHETLAFKHSMQDSSSVYIYILYVICHDLRASLALKGERGGTLHLTHPWLACYTHPGVMLESILSRTHRALSCRDRLQIPLGALPYFQLTACSNGASGHMVFRVSNLIPQGGELQGNPRKGAESQRGESSGEPTSP